jgi:D-ribose pyranose/furanose isomerase RbsD
MEVERIFCAEQIKVHPDLPKIIKDYTKAVIKANPSNIQQFSYEYFKSKVEEADKLSMENMAKEDEANAKAIDEMIFT